MRPRLLKFIDIFSRLTLAGASLALALLLDSQSADPTAPKTVFFALGVLLFAALAIFKWIWGGTLRLPQGQIARAAGSLLAVAGLAFALAPSPLRSRAAFEAWGLIFLLVFAAFDWLQGEAQRRQLLKSLSICLALACVWGLLQAVGVKIDSQDAVAQAAFGSRIASRFGNPNFFGGFLLLTIPAALYLGAESWGWYVVAALGVAMLGLSGSKAAWLGLGFQYFAWGHLHWHSTRPRELRLKFLKRWASAGIVFAGLGLAMLPAATRQRLFEAGNFRSDSVQFRLQTWEGAFKAIEARPFLGHGPGSFSAIYPAYRPDSAMSWQLQHSYEVTHAENWPLQFAVEYGLLGLATLLLFMILLGIPLWSLAHGDEAKARLAACLVLALGGSLICNLAGLDLFLPSSVYFFSLLCALALVCVSPAKPAKAPSWGRGPAWGLSALAICAFAGLSFLAFERWLSSGLLCAAESQSRAGAFSAAEPLYQEALKKDPANTEALYFWGANQLDAKQPAQALETFGQLQAMAPDYVLVHDKKARAFKALGKLDQAAAEWERQLQLDPYFLPGIQELSSLYASTGHLPDAARILEAALLHFPERDDLSNNLKLLRSKIHS